MELTNTTSRSLNKDDCFILICEGYTDSHRKTTWYRLLNSTESTDKSSGLPITNYWSKNYYYETNSTITHPNKILSSLIIHKFNEGCAGAYYCVLTNSELALDSITDDHLDAL